MFKLTFLGTSAGIPTRQRNVTSLAVQIGAGRQWWMVDCGEATQHQLQRLPLSVHDLTGICITHVHGDHSYGLPGLLASASMTGRKQPLMLIAPAAIRLWIEATLQHTEMFLTYPLIHVDVAAEREVHRQPGLSIERFALSHRAPSVGFRFSAERTIITLDAAALRAAGVAAGPDWGKLQDGQDVKRTDGTVLLASNFRHTKVERAAIVVGGDNDTPELLAEACAGVQLLVHEATYTEAQSQKVGPGPTHSSVQQVARFASKVALPNLILTHFSARYHHPAGLAELEGEARQHYGGQLFLADDLATYQLDAQGLMQRNTAAP